METQRIRMTMANTYKIANQWLTRGLFLETSYEDQARCIYTLKDDDLPPSGNREKGLKSLYRLYMACEDLTEWDFTQKHLGGWEHWEALQRATWFKPYLNRWRKELELKIKSRALKALMDEALAGGKTGFSANKFLVEKGWVERVEGKRGRPTKEEIKQELNQKDLSEAFERMQVQ